MAISEKNKEIIKTRLTNRLINARLGWEKASQLVTDIINKSDAYNMFSLCNKYGIKIESIELVYRNNTKYRLRLEDFTFYNKMFFVNAIHESISEWRKIGQESCGIIGLPCKLLRGSRDTEVAASNTLIDSLLDTNADKFIDTFNRYDDRFVSYLLEDVCDAMNKYLIALTNAYNLALQKERENDAKILAAFGLDDGDVIKIEPKRFKVTVEEVKGE